MNEFIKIIENLSGRYSVRTVFSDFVTMCSIATSNALNMNSELEAEYMSIAKKYSQDQFKLFAKMNAILVKELETNMRDFLGDVFMKLKVANNKDQYFTPLNIGTLLDRITATENDENIITVLDPTCGSGVLAIAKAKNLLEQGINYQIHLRADMTDKERLVLLMCYLQLSLLGIDAVCKVGDSIEGTVDEVWRTPMWYWHVDERRTLNTFTEA